MVFHPPAQRLTSQCGGLRGRAQNPLLENRKRDCYSDVRMKSLSRVTNSFVMTTAMLAVIIGSLCFSAGEGLRLRPFPNPTRSQIQDAGTIKGAGESNDVSKYGPLDVPAQTQTQKRNKRQALELASGTFARTQPTYTSNTSSYVYEPDGLKSLPFVTSRLGRAPPLNT